MKFLLLFLISFSTFAGYMSKVDIEDCVKANRVFHVKSSTCVGECYSIPLGYQCETCSIFDEMIDNLDSPIYEAKSSVVACIATVDDPETTEIDETKTQEQDCLEKEIAQVCDTLNGYFKVRVADNSEVYCTKLLGYDQKLSGNKVVKEDPVKKAAFDIVEQEKEDKIKDDKDAKAIAKDYFITIDCLTLKAGFEQNACEFLKR